MKINSKASGFSDLILRAGVFLALLISVFNNVAYSQFQQQWKNQLVGTLTNGTNYGQSIAVDRQNNIYVAGYVQNSQTGYDYFLIKYTPSGSTIWNRTYNGTGNGNDHAYSLTLDDFGNAYVTGSSPGVGTTNDCVTIKYDSSGNFKWVDRYEGGISRNDFGLVVKVFNNKDVYVLGASYYDLDETELDFILIKIDSSGTRQWLKRNRGGNVDSYPSKMALDRLGNIYLTGATSVFMNSYDNVVIKYNSSGNVIWQKTFDYGHYPNVANDIAVDSAGYICATGYTSIYSTDNSYLTTVKYDSSGTLTWYRLYQNDSLNFGDAGNCIGVDKNNNIIASGFTNIHESQVGTRDYLVVKYKPNGDTAWVRKYNGPGNADDWIRSMVIDKDNRIYVTGISFGAGTYFDYYTVVYDTLGNVVWSNRYNGALNMGDVPLNITLDNTQNIIVTGSACETGAGIDVVTIKYSKTVGISNYNEIVPREFSLYQNYPNPFNPSTKIIFDLPQGGKIKLVIYDILGRKIKSLIDDVFKQAGEYSVEFNGSDLISGVYFYRLQVEGERIFTDVKKMVLIK